MLVRFSNINDCVTCTQTIDMNKLRAIGMFQTTANDPNSYYVRLSFDGGDTLTVKKNMTLSQAIDYRTLLEGYWSGYSSNILGINAPEFSEKDIPSV